jgi:hypothetical protein
MTLAVVFLAYALYYLPPKFHETVYGDFGQLIFPGKSRLIFCEFLEPLDACCPSSFQIDIQTSHVHIIS